MSDQVFIYTMNQGRGTQGRWSRYVFPFTIQVFAHLRDDLYLRHGDTVSKVVEGELYDDNVAFEGVIQWPWLDFRSPGRDKLMMGFDIVGEGTVSVEVGYDQTNLDGFTTSFAIPEDSAPGQIIPLPVTAPSFSIRLTYDGGQAWEWNALQLYLQDFHLGK